MEKQARIKVGGIMAKTGLAMVNVLSLPARPGVCGILLHRIGKKNINIEFVVYCPGNDGNGSMTFCVDHEDFESASKVTEEVKPLIEAKRVSYGLDVAMISVFGPHFREKPMISGLMFEALGRAGIEVLAISTSISTCSCLIRGDHAEDAMEILHQTFEAPYQVTKFAP